MRNVFESSERGKRMAKSKYGEKSKTKQRATTTTTMMTFTQRVSTKPVSFFRGVSMTGWCLVWKRRQRATTTIYRIGGERYAKHCRRHFCCRLAVSQSVSRRISLNPFRLQNRLNWEELSRSSGAMGWWFVWGPEETDPATRAVDSKKTCKNNNNAPNSRAIWSNVMVENG